MEFKFSSSIFKNSPEDLQRLYGDKFDPNKNYPNFTGTLGIPVGSSLEVCRTLAIRSSDGTQA